MEMSPNKKAYCGNSKLNQKTKENKMQTSLAYHESNLPALEIVQGLQVQFKNIHETLCMIRNLVLLSGDDKAAALVDEMSIAAIGPMHRVRIQLNVPY